MSKFSFSFVLPLRGGSKRVLQKNTRTFAEIEGGLAAIKIAQLIKCKGVEKIYITTDDEETMRIAAQFNDERIIIDKRPDYLCSSETKIEDLILYIGNLCNSEHIYWVHATAPFVGSKTYEKALAQYEDALENGFDSLMSVTKIQQFIWHPELKKVINNSSKTTRWPQTQDLAPLYEINHAFYINSRQNYFKQGDRIGQNPSLFPLGKLECLDIDWPEDFEMGEYLYKSALASV
jgi:CMP-N-acetylneuraminic acid synthetase